jgi:hypothetical protein
MRLKDILRSAALFTRTNLLGEAANDEGAVIHRDALAYIAKGDFGRGDNTVRLAQNWERIADLVNNALQNLPEEYSAESVDGLSKLHDTISSIAQRIDETNVFVPTIELDQQDVDDLLTLLPHMGTAVSYYNGVIRDGTTFIGVDLDDENDQIRVNSIENGPAQFAFRHIEEIQMFRIRSQSQLTTSTKTTYGLQALGF